MLYFRIFFNLNRLNQRFCTTQSGSDKPGLDRFLNVVKDTKSDSNKLKKDESRSILENSAESVDDLKFTKLFRHSDLVQKGFIKNGFLTSGIITHVVNQTIFIDYGGKFPFITNKPEKNKEAYVRGAKVLVKILDWELTARFIGMDTDSTLCESEGRLVKLLKTPYLQNKDISNNSVIVNEKSEIDEIENYLKNVESKIKEPFDSKQQKFKQPSETSA